MANKNIMQFRYYNNTNINNQPANITKAKLVSGNAFNNYLPITQLGIQTLPGTKFYLNHSVVPTMIGSTGIYELNLEGLSKITSISFDSKSIKAIEENDGAYLIIDIVYEVEEES